MKGQLILSLRLNWCDNKTLKEDKTETSIRVTDQSINKDILPYTPKCLK